MFEIDKFFVIRVVCKFTGFKYRGKVDLEKSIDCHIGSSNSLR